MPGAERKGFPLEIVLEVDPDHCVETAAREEYERIARVLLREGTGGEDLGEKLEMLREFLMTADFPALRRESEQRFLRGEAVRFFLRHKGGGLSCGFLGSP